MACAAVVPQSRKRRKTRVGFGLIGAVGAIFRVVARYHGDFGDGMHDSTMMAMMLES